MLKTSSSVSAKRKAEEPLSSTDNKRVTRAPTDLSSSELQNEAAKDLEAAIGNFKGAARTYLEGEWVSEDVSDSRHENLVSARRKASEAADAALAKVRNNIISMAGALAESQKPKPVAAAEPTRLETRDPLASRRSVSAEPLTPVSATAEREDFVQFVNFEDRGRDRSSRSPAKSAFGSFFAVKDVQDREAQLLAGVPEKLLVPKSPPVPKSPQPDKPKKPLSAKQKAAFRQLDKELDAFLQNPNENAEKTDGNASDESFRSARSKQEEIHIATEEAEAGRMPIIAPTPTAVSVLTKVAEAESVEPEQLEDSPAVVTATESNFEDPEEPEVLPSVTPAFEAKAEEMAPMLSSKNRILCFRSHGASFPPGMTHDKLVAGLRGALSGPTANAHHIIAKSFNLLTPHLGTNSQPNEIFIGVTDDVAWAFFSSPVCLSWLKKKFAVKSAEGPKQVVPEQFLELADLKIHKAGVKLLWCNRSLSEFET